MYNVIKKVIPSSLRLRLKPFYQKWNLRSFQKSKVVPVHAGLVSFKIELNPKNGAVDEYIFIHRNWEPQVGSVICRLLQPGDVFIDVGANIGYFSLLAANLVGKSGKVIAFEPLPPLVEQIKRSADVNVHNWLTVVPKALGDRPGCMELAISDINIGGSSLVSADSDKRTVSVDVSTLDAELAAVKKVDLIKVDVEGFEYEMLQGARQVLSDFKPAVILEFSPHFYKKRNSTMAKDIATLLQGYGYQFTILQTGEKINNVDQLLSVVGDKQVDLLCTILQKEK